MLAGIRRLAAVLTLLSAAACSDIEASLHLVEPSLADDAYVASDGMRLPVRAWRPDGAVRAVIVAAHGMNDYGMAWARPATRWAERGIVTYAVDQRGFGAAGERGRWYGAETMAADIAGVARLAARRHPGAPVYIMGESMGGAVAVLAATRPDAPALAGVILSAPAIWPDSFIGRVRRGEARAAGFLLPDLTVPPRDIQPAASDDPTVMEQLHADPLVIQETRLATLAGVVDLMDQARRRGPELPQRVLLLLGDDDVRIFRDALSDLAGAMPKATVALYPGGRHLLFRSLGAAAPTEDVTSWVLWPDRPLPSGAQARGERCRRFIPDPSPCAPPPG